MWRLPATRRRAARGLTLVLTLLLGLGLLPTARAEIVLVTPDSAAPVALAPAEQARVDALLAARQVLLLSTVSPDGTTVLVGTLNQVAHDDLQLHYLNVATGALADGPPLDLPAAEALELSRAPMVWRDNHTLQFAHTTAANQPEIVTLNTAADVVARLTLELDGEVLGYAPDFSRLLLVRTLTPPRPEQRNSDLGERQLLLVDLATHEQREIAHIEPGFYVRPPSWSRDGTHLAVVLGSTHRHERLARTPSSLNLADPLVQDAFGNLPPARNPLLQANLLQIYDLRHPEPLVLTLAARAGNGDSLESAVLSPDGQHLLVRMQRPSRLPGRAEPIYGWPDRVYYRVCALDGTLQATVDRPELEAPTHSEGQWATDQTLLFSAPLGTNQGLYAYPLAAGALQALPLPPGSVEQKGTVTPDGRTVLYSFSSVLQPPEVFRVALDGAAPPVALTRFNAALAAVDHLRADEVAFTLADGQERRGLLLQPADAGFPPRGVPIVFWQEGGPGLEMLNRWSAKVEAPFNLLPNFGLAVLMVPLVGREGYGPEFLDRLAAGDNFGRLDFDEGAEIIEQLIARSFTTRAQTGVTGYSYGGYYASQLITLYPDLVAAANPQAALLDTIAESQLGSNDFLAYWVGRTPMEDVERHRQISPLYRASGIRTPTLVFHGSKDFLWVDLARTFHDVLMLHGVPVTMYEFTEAPHGLETVADERIAAQLQIDFFRRYLQPEALPGTTARGPADGVREAARVPGTDPGASSGTAK